MSKARKEKDERKKAQIICPEDSGFEPFTKSKQKEQSFDMAKLYLHSHTTILAEAYNTKKGMLCDHTFPI